MRAPVLTLCFAIAICSVSWADELVRTTDGRQILLKNDGSFEIITESDTVVGDYRVMSFEDFRLDIDELHGELVEVVAEISSMGGMLMLTDPRDDFDMNPVFAEEGDLSREERRHIMNRCSLGCRLTVRGEVRSIMFQAGLRLHSLGS